MEQLSEKALEILKQLHSDWDCLDFESEYLPLLNAINRLSEYEATQLPPDICTEYKTFEDEAVSKSVPFKRIVELMEAESAGRLVVLNLAPQVAYNGLRRKYIVFKSDTGKPVENCFVLRPDRDRAARDALRAYIVSTDNLDLARDLDDWLNAL